MSITRKLIVESPSYELEYEQVQENINADKRYYLFGKYAKVDEINKNGRIYEWSEFGPALKVYDEQYIQTSRAGGELGHSQNPDMDLSKLAHKIVELHRCDKDPKYIIGKSMILSTPSGKILENLTKDGLVYGMSSKILARLQESSEGNLVKSPIIVGIDAVYDPSVSTAFVNGILENKEYIIGDNNKAYEAFTKFEKHLSKYPTHHRDAINQHILEGFKRLMINL
jgi:hypothetical protein